MNGLMVALLLIAAAVLTPFAVYAGASWFSGRVLR